MTDFHASEAPTQGIRLEEVIPWGRSLPEYVQMFGLTPAELQLTILDCASGPASFNAEMTQQGYSVLSCDPLYQFSAEEIAARIQHVYPVLMAKLEENQDRYVWRTIASPADLGATRMAAMQRFLADFPAGFQQGRYQNLALPDLPFADRQFDLTLCSHFLFSYSEHLNLEFHLAALRSLARVAREARVFPLLDISGEPSAFVQPAIVQLQSEGYSISIHSVPYEFQRGGNQVLKIQTQVPM